MRAPDPPPVPMPRPRSAHIPPRSCSPLPPPSRNPSGPRSCTQVTVWRTALWTRIPPLCGFLPSAPPPRGRILSIAPPPQLREHTEACADPPPRRVAKGKALSLLSARPRGSGRAGCSRGRRAPAGPAGRGGVACVPAGSGPVPGPSDGGTPPRGSLRRARPPRPQPWGPALPSKGTLKHFCVQNLLSRMAGSPRFSHATRGKEPHTKISHLCGCHDILRKGQL